MLASVELSKPRNPRYVAILALASGLILFSVGSVFEFSLFRRIGRQVLLVTVVESALAAGVVTGGALWLGQPWPVALLLGAIATATAPASTLMVIRECDSAGPLTDNLLGIIAVNNLLCMTTYGLVAARAGVRDPVRAARDRPAWAGSDVKSQNSADSPP